MKKVVSLVLVFVMVCSLTPAIFATGQGEAQIISPNNEVWIDPYKATTVKWTTPSSGLNYKVTIKNERTGKYIVQNESVNGNSYSIKSNILDFEERYVIWVGTYSEDISVGRGDSIVISTYDRYSSQKVYQEAEFSYPLNNQEIPADKDLIITLSGNSDLAYNLTVKDVTTGGNIVDKTDLTKTSYTIKSNLLTEGHTYKAWVGTYKKASKEKLEFGAGKTIEFRTEKKIVNTPPAYDGEIDEIPEDDNDAIVNENNDENRPPRPVVDTTENSKVPERPVIDTEDLQEPSYDAAKISVPSNREWLDPTKKITIKWNKPASELEYCLNIKNDVSGEYIVKNKYTSSSSYNIAANTLYEQQRYKVTLSTYVGDSLVGSDEIYFNTNDVDYEEAAFSYPANNDTIEVSSKLTIRLSNTDSDFCYRISIVDQDSNKSIVKNKAVSGSTYSLAANKLEPGKKYKLWVGTYINSDAANAVGIGNTIYIYTNSKKEDTKDATVEAVFTSPKDNEVTNYKSDLTIKWSKSNANTCYEVTVKNLTDNTYLVQNKVVTGTSYKIKASELKGKHEYKAWIGTYNNTSNQKAFIGKGDELCFSTDGTMPILIKSLTADIDDNGLAFKYELVGDNFGYAHILVKDSKNKTIYEGKEYDLSGEIIVDTDKLEEGVTYTCEIQTYDSKNKEAAYKAPKYTVAKSDFSISEETKPTGTYNDISSNHKNYNAIKQLSIDGILAGDGTGCFHPEDSITRAEFVKVICEAYGIYSGKSTDFTDIKGHWAKEYIESAYNAGIINGTSSTTFSPNDNITYAQIAKIIITLKGWESTAKNLGGYPNGYVKVMINNNLFDNSSKHSSEFKNTDFYNSFSSRADVAQLIYNANLHTGNDKTKTETEESNVKDSIATIPNEISKETVYTVTDDLGNNVQGTTNPSPQQIYNYVYNRIHKREVYQKDPNVLNAIMAMIWTESGGIHYKNGEIYSSLNSDSADYGLCQLNSNVFDGASNWGWQKNLDVGIDKFASNYWMCMGEETKNEKFLNSVEKALTHGYAKTYQEARARTAYSMYNHNNDNRERWFTKKDSRDANFNSHYINKYWAKTLVSTGNEIIETKPTSQQTNTNNQNSIKYDGKTYTYETGNKYDVVNYKIYKIRTKEYTTDDYANIQDVWKVFYGYNPTLYDNNPLYGKLEWYCQGVGSLVVEFDLRNASDDNTKQFDIYRLKQDGSKYKLPSEYLGYNKFITDKITMTKNGNTAFIGVQCLANIFACSIDYKNAITPNANMISSLQKVTDNLNDGASTMPNMGNKDEIDINNSNGIKQEQTTLDLSDSSLYIKQTKSYCTLDAMAVVFRRRAFLDGNNSYSIITENSMIKQGNWINGLSNNPKYKDKSYKLNMNASSKRLNYSKISESNFKVNGNAEMVKNELISMLNEHPEGIVLYVFHKNLKWMHAVTLTGYDGNTFYCADPITGKGIIPLMSSSLVDKKHANTSEINDLFSHCVKIWWVTSHDNN